MLARMLMVQMSVHMVMQSRTTVLYMFPCYQSAVWNLQCRVGSAEYVKCRMRGVKCRVWGIVCKV